jgi:hypothetical protein
MRSRRAGVSAIEFVVYFAVALLAACMAVLPARAESDATADPVFQINFSHPQLVPSHWEMTIHPDGKGHFKSESGSQKAGYMQGLQVVDVDRDIELSKDFAQRVFATTRRKKLFNTNCNSKMNVAFTGWKSFSYSGPDGEGLCKFNYSEDKEIQALSESLQAVAETVIEGARLQMLMQHDRLGLDKEMELLATEVDAGRAGEIYLISRILERLADDPAVLQRVRKRASLLLAGLSSERPDAR